MKNIIKSLILFALVTALFAAPFQNGAWCGYESIKSESDIEFGNNLHEETPFSSNTRSNIWFNLTVDSVGSAGYSTSIALDNNSRPHISYCNSTNDDLKYAYYDGNQWHNETVDSLGTVGWYTSIALDSNGHPHISYYTNTGDDLKYAYFDGNQWHNEIVDSQGSVGRYTSIALDSNDRPHISYRDNTNIDLKYAYYDGNQWHNETVDSQDSVGGYTSIALDSNDRPHISYTDGTNLDLKYAYYDGNQWHNEIVDSQGNVGGEETSIALDSNDRPHISYTDGTNHDLKYAYYDGNQWHNETVDSQGSVGYYTSIALDSNDHPHISYYNVTNYDLKYAYYDGNQWHNETVDSQGWVGKYTSIALDSNDQPHISYYDQTNHNLKYAFMDGVPPSLDSDHSPDSGTTGDNFEFNISASDNIRVDTVNVNWSHGGLSGNKSLVSNNGYWVAPIILDDSVNNMTYTIYINDPSYNYNISSKQTVTVSDNDKPDISMDNSANIGTTGDEFAFNVSATDNIGVDTICVNWSHGGLNGNESLALTNGYYLATIVIDNNLGNLVYTIYVNDTSNLFNISSQQTIPVTDNDKPSYADNGLNSGTTGDSYQFNISATDNINVSTVKVNWSHGDLNDNESLTLIDSYWVASIALDHNISALTYTIYVNDTSNNFNISGLVNVAITDNDIPQLGTQWNNTLTTGDLAVFSVNITENIAVVSVMFNFTIDETYFNWSVSNNTGTNWTITITVPSQATGIDYYFWVNDTSDNRNKTGMSGLKEIADDDIPMFEGDMTNGTPTTGDTFYLVLNASDNVGVALVYVNYTYNGIDHINESMSLSRGFYNSTINVTDDATYVAYKFYIHDGAGNVLEVVRPQIIVEDNDKPIFDTDHYLGTPTTGDPFTILMNASDNIGVNAVHVWYMFDDGIPHNESMTYDNDNIWNRTISIPATATSLTYRFYISDAAGNLLNVTRPSRNVLDNDKPATPAHTPGTPETGKYYNFTITLMDNIGISSANITYSFNHGVNLSSELTSYSGNQWNGSIYVPVNAVFLNYSYMIYDTTGNQVVTPIFHVAVEDIIAPYANAGDDKVIDQRNETMFNGNLSSDNIGITNFTWIFTYDGVEKKLYGQEVNFSFNVPGNYTIVLTVADDMGNVDNDTFNVTVISIHSGDDDTGDDDIGNDDIGNDDTEDDDIVDDDADNDDISDDDISDDDDDGTDDSTGLSGMIMELTIGGIVLVLTIFIIVFVVLRKKRKKESVEGDVDSGSQEILEDAPEQESEEVPSMEVITDGDDTPQHPVPQEVMAAIPPTADITDIVEPSETFVEDVEEEDKIQPIEEPEPEVTPSSPPEKKIELKPVPESMSNMIPGYILTHRLGSGGFATVYLALNSKGKKVAVKLPKFTDETLDMSVLKKFKAEADIWKKLKHKNIVTFYTGDIQPVPYLVIEYMKGGNLLKLLKEDPIPIDVAISLIQEVLSGMAYAHRMASVHRDLKPENILFTEDGIPKISDWGIGKFMASESTEKTMGTKGTLVYSAPEQVSPKKYGEVDWSTDVFQLGIMFYELLTGNNPFSADDPIGIINNIINEIPVPPSSLRPGIPPEIDTVILRALEKEKDKRFSSADSMLEEMKRVLKG